MTINEMKDSMMTKLNYDDVQLWIKEAGYECGKNTAMVDVFYRFANIVMEKSKCEPKKAEKPEVKIEKASASLPLPSSPSPLPPSSPSNLSTKRINIE